ncbi:MAG: chromosome condensation regulator, partial [Clostridia bacterium]|nr:chromosome condensation regulator [Clostridia bacterium]
VSLAADYIVAVGLDGRAYAAGRSEDIVKEVNEWTDIEAVSAADKYCVGLKRDGTLVFSGKFDFEKE